MILLIEDKRLPGLDALPTPDSTPTKQDNKATWRVSEVLLSPRDTTVNRRHSDSWLESPRPTEAKLTKCLNEDKSIEILVTNSVNNGEIKPKREDEKLSEVGAKGRSRARKGGKTKRGGTTEKASRNRPKSAPPTK